MTFGKIDKIAMALSMLWIAIFVLVKAQILPPWDTFLWAIVFLVVISLVLGAWCQLKVKVPVYLICLSCLIYLFIARQRMVDLANKLSNSVYEQQARHIAPHSL